MIEAARRRAGFFLALATSLLLIAAGPAAAAPYSDIVVDAKTGKVLSATSADALRHPASLTKMMTLYMVFEALHDGRLRWDQKIMMSKNGARTIPTKLGIPAGKTFTVREAVNGMIVKSANDAAEAMGDHLGGSEAKFAQMMTRKARQLGMKKSIFYNASGLPHRRQVTTARDMATLGIALKRDFPREYKLFSQSSFVFRGKRIRGHNRMLSRYRGVDGIKTGYVNASGFNIVTAVNHNGRSVVGVVIGGKTARRRDDRMVALLDQTVGKASARAVQIASIKAKPDDVVVASIAPTPKPRRKSMEAAVSDAEESIETSRTLAAQPVAAGGAWEVQIAATDTKAQASKLLARAGKALGGEFAGIRPRTEPVARGSATLHRARLTGFDSRQTAQAACTALKARDYDCLVVN